MIRSTQNLIPILCVAAVTLWSTSAFARSWRANQFPHGSQIDCTGCHLMANGSGLNDFGFDSSRYVDASRNLTWNAQFAAEDSDNDGYTNGYELGDPNGTWRIGDPQPGGAYWEPGDKTDSPCGNGSIEGPEACDGTIPGGMNCASLDLGPGNLGCDDKCQFTTENCGACGDGNLNPGFEDCDGADLQEATCVDVGYEDGGTLACEVGGCTFDTSGCNGVGPDGQCGDGELQASEQCDGDNFGGNTCVLLGFEGGQLNCFLDCTLDFIQCFGNETQPNNSTGGNNSGGNNGGGGGGGGNDADGTSINGEGACASTQARPSSPIWLALFALLWVMRSSSRSRRD